jgi:hypothetical protein
MSTEAVAARPIQIALSDHPEESPGSAYLAREIGVPDISRSTWAGLLRTCRCASAASRPSGGRYGSGTSSSRPRC